MATAHLTYRQRLPGAIGALLVSAGLGALLVSGLQVPVVRVASDAISVFGLLPPPPPPPPPPRPKPPPRTASTKPQGAAAPPNLRSKATEIVAPKPPKSLPVPPPVVVAPKAGTGAQASSGAADVAGPGTGAGGAGNGTGSGGSGQGEGSGDESPPRLIKGRIKDSDFPKGAATVGAGGTVSVDYVVRADGSVGDCTVTHSSGNAELDQTTCRLIQERFRYEPSRRPDGTPVESEIVEDHSWIVHNEPPESDR